MPTPLPSGPVPPSPSVAVDHIAAAEQAGPRRRSLVHHPDFRRLWTGDALAQFGAQITGLALPLLAVQTLDASEWQMGALNAARTSAFLVIGLPTGAWVDRMRKRRVLIVADLVRATVLTAAVTITILGHGSMPLLYVSALVISAASVFFDVAHQSYVPGLVGQERIGEGNAMLQATQSVSQVAGPAIGGALLRLMTTPALLAADAVIYLFSAVAIGRIRAEEELPARSERRRLRTEIAEGLRFVLGHDLLRRIIACTSISNMAGSVTGALSVLYMLRTLNFDTSTLGFVLSASAVGGLLGAVASNWIGRLVGEARLIPLAAVAIIPSAALTPLAATLRVPPYVTLVVGGLLFSFAAVVYNVAQVTFRQRVCPPALLGRMNATVRFFVWGSMPLGALVGGWLGNTIGIVPTLWVAVCGIGVASLPVLLSPLVTMRELPGASTATVLAP